MRIAIADAGRESDSLQLFGPGERGFLVLPFDDQVSATCSPTRTTGLSTFMAPWKTMAILFQRISRRNCSSDMVVSSRPAELNRAAEELDILGNMRMSAVAIEVLPNTRFADDTDCLTPFLDGKGDAVDRVDWAFPDL